MANHLLSAMTGWGGTRGMWMDVINHALYSVADDSSRRCLDDRSVGLCPYCMEVISLQHFSTIAHAQAVHDEWLSMGGNMDALEFIISRGWLLVGHKDFNCVTGEFRASIFLRRWTNVPRTPRAPRAPVPPVADSECPICYEPKNCPKVEPCGHLVCLSCWPMCRGRCPLCRAVGSQVFLI